MKINKITAKNTFEMKHLMVSAVRNSSQDVKFPPQIFF